MCDKRFQRWRNTWVLLFSLFVSGCEQPSRAELTLAHVQETIKQFDHALETMNAALLSPLISPTIIATFYEAGSGQVTRYEGSTYFTLMRDVLGHE